VGAVNVLVANAGLPGTGALGEYSREQVDKVLDVNLNAPVHLTHILLPKMIERGSGHLVYMGSISSKVATAWSSLYNATKFGLRGFAFALHEELKGTGVGTTTVFPGPISDAGMWADGGLDLPRGVSARSPEQVAAAVIKGIETDKPEIDVAHPVMRLGGWLAGPAPRVVGAINRRVGANETAAALSERQKVKR
jgi:short-subunit dehydrogenase